MRQRRVSRPGTPPLPSPPPMTRVLIVDDDDLMRAGLRELLSNDPSIEIAGEASTGREAVERARRLAPDVVLMDVRMPDLDEIAAALTVEESTIRTHVKRVLMKLNLRDRVQAVIFAYESGINSPSAGANSARSK